VKDMIAEGTESGIFKPAEKDMLEGVMRLADRTVRTIMTPRVDMMWLSAEDSARDNHAIIRSSGYSRFPVAKGDLEEILGIVYAKDMLNAVLGGQLSPQMPPLKSVMRPALTVPDTTPVLRLLEQFKRSKQHIAIVADEYGSVEGLVSVTDILKAITGDLPERGQDSDSPSVQRADGSWLMDGMAPLDEVESRVGLKDMRGEGDFHTLGGFVVDKLHRLPNAGDHFVWGETRFEVVDMDGRRVDKVLVTPPPEETPHLEEK
jgi:putative hemolysin